MQPVSSLLMVLEGVKKNYTMGTGEVCALKHVDLAICRGERVAIVGASGSGKSTLLHILGALDTPTEGSYRFDDLALHLLSAEERAVLRNRKMGFVFQAFHLLPRYTALQNVELPQIYAGERIAPRRERAQVALQRVGLADRAQHKPTELSGGQQQRVAIARAIVNNPLVLLADEPTGALDSKTSAQVMSLLCELHEQGMTLVLVTHDPQVAGYAHRIINIADGEIVSDIRENNHDEEISPTFMPGVSIAAS